MTSCAVSLTAVELKEKDPRRFKKEYSKWTEWQWEDDWYVEDATEFFKQKYAPMGINIETLRYAISYSQGDFASFDGRIRVADWMAAVRLGPDRQTYAERFPALYLACLDDGTYMDVTGEGHRRGWRSEWMEYWQTIAPSGVFSGLEEEAWDELVNEQAAEADLERAILDQCRSIGGEIYDYLRESYEAATSEEAFIESCEINEVTFEVEE